jgi:CRISPR-associated endonuclease/helicase Cas3
MLAMEPMFRYWGKARPLSTEGPQYHLLPYHCLDVAAVGQRLLVRHPKLARFLAERLGMETESFCRYAVFLLVLHDLGKFAESFQNLRPDLLSILQGREKPQTQTIRHDTLGFGLWRDAVRSRLAGGRESGRSKSRRSSTANHSIDDWVRAVTGHHGKPPIEDSTVLIGDYFKPADIEAAWSFIQEAAGLLLDGNLTLPQPESERMAEVSWLLAGFSVLCDWLGSNEGFFGYRTQVMLLAAYWEHAQQSAERALFHAGILPNELSEYFQLDDCFPNLKAGRIQPTPLQQLAASLPLTDSPQLVILEDVTGAGKTEAALLLTHRLMKQTGATGFYFALPTMATANGMYRRMKAVYRRLFSAGSMPSLVLAHSARELSAEFDATVLPGVGQDTLQRYGDDTEPAEALCSAWLADNRKTALLAAAGIGTVDQALLTVLPSRHQSLRMLGLLGKVLVVDEVHAFDAYTHRLLQALLSIHARLGGSAILLSATLPTSQRQAFVDAFAAGRQASGAMLEKTALTDYPLLSVWRQGGVMERPVDTRDSVKRTVRVELVHEMETVEHVLQQSLKQGRCLCWIRNTVADARETYTDLRGRYPNASMNLFHARFALQDRLDIENRVLDAFGPQSTEEQRKGRILIATQVVEQSLDLDFDVLVTDLAPIDLIIQRAGRLCRHTRDVVGNRIDGPDQRGEPKLFVYAPAPDTETDSQWFTRSFPKAGKVYPHHGQLWLTVALLRAKSQFAMPEDARFLIEGVYGDEAQSGIPEGLQNKSWTAEGDSMAKNSLAGQNALSWDKGYRDVPENRWFDEAVTPTRLGEDRTTVYLARWINGELVPWINEGLHRWQRSAVQVRRAIAVGEGRYEEISAEVIEACKHQLPAKGRWGVVLPLLQQFPLSKKSL